MIQEFIAGFTKKDIGDIRKLGKRYYLIDKNISEVAGRINTTPESIGLFLGEEKKGQFLASVALIDILSQKSEKKMFLDEKSAWLFLCGRDVMAKSIIRSHVDKGLVIVQNEKDENLGLGKVIGDIRQRNDRIVVKNVIDKGDFLRREMNR